MGNVPESPETDDRRNNIDALRLVLSLLVLLSHCYPLASGTEAFEPLALLSNNQLTLGGFAVDGFFILSGYLIVQSWDRSRSVRSYLMKRVRRIYPGYLAAVAVCVWIVIPLASPNGRDVFSFATVFDNIWRFLLLRGFHGPGAFLENPHPRAVNGSLWSIPYEFWCYIGVMLLGLAGCLKRRRLLLALLVGAVISHFVFQYCSLKIHGGFLREIFGSPRGWARLLPCYLAGIVLARYRECVPVSGKLAALAFLMFLLAARVSHGLIIAIPTCGTYLLFWVAFTGVVRWHNAAKWGDFSYGIYLYAFPIQQLTMYYLGRPVAPLLLFALCLVPTLLAGIASWFLVERWFLVSTKHPRKSPQQTVSGD